MIEEREEPTLLVRTMRDTVLPMRSRWEIGLAEDGDGCVLVVYSSITVSGRKPSACVLRFIVTVSRSARRSVVTYFRRVARGLGVKPRLLRDRATPS